MMDEPSHILHIGQMITRGDLDAVQQAIAQRDAEIDRLQVENAKLREFAAFVLDASGEIPDAEDIGEKAQELGLLVEVRATEPCAMICMCAEVGDFPRTCWRVSDIVKRKGGR